MFNIEGKVALVTGSTRGIGKAVVEAMAEQGAKVVVSSRKQEACDTVADGIVKRGGEAIALPCNIGHLDQIDSLVDATMAHFGRIDMLICNAAVNPYYGPLVNITESAYDKTMDTNVKSNVWLCNKVIPQMAARREGSVVIVSSVAAFIGSALLGTYGLSKAADVALTRNLAVEWGRRNVRVNCVNPAIIRTGFSRALWEDSKNLERAVAHYPLGRIGEPEEVASAVIFLSSPGASFITGETLTIDGGALINGASVG